jgi:succinate dehydrogenase flavin-adding protein (antitoxin of CptAB toxin-antitoxin module)
MNEIEILKKKIIYRSKSLGYRESSLVIQSFLKRHIDILTFNELKSMMDLVNMDDHHLMNFLMLDSYSLSYEELEAKIMAIL